MSDYPDYPDYPQERDTFRSLLGERMDSRGARLVTDESLRAFCEASWQAKTALARTWGLTEPDRRLRLDTVDREAFHRTAEYQGFHAYLATYHADRLSAIVDLDQKILDNRLDEGKQTYRLIRWARKHVDAEQFKAFMVRRNDATWAGLPVKLEAFIEQLLQTGSELRLPAIVSLNPLDFLLMSDCCKYTSCTTIGHQHPAGNTSHALDDMTGMVFSLRPSPAQYPFAKLGRSLVYQPGDRRKIVFMRVYGIMNDLQIKEVSNQLSRRTAATLKMDNSWTAVQNTSFRWDQLPHQVGHRQHHGPSASSDTNFPIFMDFSVVRLAIHESALEAKQVGFAEECTDGSCPEGTYHGDSRLPELTPHPEAMCLACGELHRRPGVYVCPACGERCTGCGRSRPIYEYVQSEPYCEPCYSALPSCANCLRALPRGETGRYCGACQSTVGTCANCGDEGVIRFWLTRCDHARQMICAACRSTLRSCAACEARRLPADFHPDTSYCLRCPAPCCPSCNALGRTYQYYSIRYGRDVPLCPACAVRVFCSACGHHVLRSDCHPGTEVCLRHDFPHEISEPESEPIESEGN